MSITRREAVASCVALAAAACGISRRRRNASLASNERIFTPFLRGDGQTDERAAIQRSIDDCAEAGGGTVLLGRGVYLMGAVPVPGGAGAVCLLLRSGVHLRGAGFATILRVRNRCYGPGALFAAVGCDQSAPLSSSAISDLTVDGARVGQVASRQANNIMLTCHSDVTVERVLSANANGTGIMLFGLRGRSAHNLRVQECLVRSAAYIGIQASQFDGCVIEHNVVEDTVDNAIDIYGENGTTNSSASDFRIANNAVSACSVGVFVETSRDGIVTGNTVHAARTAGIAVNRINGEPRNISLNANDIEAPIGIRVTGDTGGVAIEHNEFRRFTTAGVQLGDSAGNVSRVTITDNLFEGNGASPAVLVWGRQASFLKGVGNRSRNNSGAAMPGVEYRSGRIVDVALDGLLAPNP
jgi:hypothetical protein